MQEDWDGSLAVFCAIFSMISILSGYRSTVSFATGRDGLEVQLKISAFVPVLQLSAAILILVNVEDHYV